MRGNLAAGRGTTDLGTYHGLNTRWLEASWIYIDVKLDYIDDLPNSFALYVYNIKYRLD